MNYFSYKRYKQKDNRYEITLEGTKELLFGLCLVKMLRSIINIIYN